MIVRETGNWRIELTAAPEEDSPDMSFDWDVDDREEVFAKINDGTWLWFTALVRVIHKPTGTVAGTDSLGACCYESLAQFAEQGGYLRGMVSEAIDEARNHPFWNNIILDSPSGLWEAEVRVVNDPAWYGNGKVFYSKDEAAAYAEDLFIRWGQAVGWRVSEVAS